MVTSHKDNEEAFLEWYDSLREHSLSRTAAAIGASTILLIYSLEEIRDKISNQNSS